MAPLSVSRRRHVSLFVAGLLLAVGGACAPPEAPPRVDGVRRVLAHVRGIT